MRARLFCHQNNFIALCICHVVVFAIIIFLYKEDFNAKGFRSRLRVAPSRNQNSIHLVRFSFSPEKTFSNNILNCYLPCGLDVLCGRHSNKWNSTYCMYVLTIITIAGHYQNLLGTCQKSFGSNCHVSYTIRSYKNQVAFYIYA